MRLAFIISYIANVVLALVSLAVLPERVAIHFGPGGIPNNWAPSHVNSLIFLGMHSLLFLALYFSPRLTFIFPAKWINLPNKQFWLAPANRSQTASKLSALIFQYGVALFLFLLVINLLTLQANLADPVKLDERLFLPFLLLFLAYTAVWCIGFFRSFQIPKASVPATATISPK